MRKNTNNLLRDLFYITGSICGALVLAKTNAVALLLANTHMPALLASFVSGIFFTSVFTTAPAMVALGEIAQHNNLLATAAFGALGAVLGDFIIFRFVRDHVADDLQYIFHKLRRKKISLLVHRKFWELKAFRWVVPLTGALIIASPLPDELGLAILGLSKIKTSQMIPLTFLFNMIGILLIGVVARTL
jgi:membrane protein DedA with SNARE-associated domain